jgi:hypothetical protein
MSSATEESADAARVLVSLKKEGHVSAKIGALVKGLGRILAATKRRVQLELSSGRRMWLDRTLLRANGYRISCAAGVAASRPVSRGGFFKKAAHVVLSQNQRAMTVRELTECAQTCRLPPA